jgi:hypothetical protein
MQGWGLWDLIKTTPYGSVSPAGNATGADHHESAPSTTISATFADRNDRSLSQETSGI